MFIKVPLFPIFSCGKSEIYVYTSFDVMKASESLGYERNCKGQSTNDSAKVYEMEGQ